MVDKIYFVTSNDFKKEEALKVFEGTGIELDIVTFDIVEIMSFELETIVRDKVLKAYKKFGLPCAVEHGALNIASLNGLPGGISKVVWDKIGDKICQLLPISEPRVAIAKSVVGYCDGKKIHLFTGETKGQITETSRGDRKFQWDPIFIPEGMSETYAELGLDKKKSFSQGTKAWQKLIESLI